VYTPKVRRIQLYVDDELDDELNVEAARRGRSRSDLVREAVRQWLRAGASSSNHPDSVEQLVGAVDVEPVDDIDTVVYGEP